MRLKILLPCILLYLGYIVGGGGIFHLLEYENQNEEYQEMKERIESWLDNYDCVTEEELRQIIGLTLENSKASQAYVANITDLRSDWDIASASFVALTIITTIGYGHLAPETIGGQIFCVFYAVFGIPLNILVLGGIGLNLNILLRKCQNKKISFRLLAFTRAIVLLVSGIVIFLCLPALAIFVVEDWTYWKGWYYCFITLTTIGFGDLTPGSQLDVEYSLWYRITISIWITFGLAWLATLLAIATDTVRTQVTNVASRIKKRKKKRANNEVTETMPCTICQDDEYTQVFELVSTPAHVHTYCPTVSATDQQVDIRGAWKKEMCEISV